MKSHSQAVGNLEDSSKNRIVLEPHHVHMWYAFLPQHCEKIAENQLRLLTAKERSQHERFHFERDRHRYLVTRALVRTVLSRYAPIAPEDWVFESGRYGRPSIVNAHPQASRICFNISHTSGLVVLAITSDLKIGVDTEATVRDAPLEVADRFFSTREANELRTLPKSDQPLRFWELWTLKESYIKAREMGLSLPLDQFSFNFKEDGGVSIAFENGIDDSPKRWKFWQFKPDEYHLVALCLEQKSDDRVEFLSWRIQPLGIVRPMNVAISRTSSC